MAEEFNLPKLEEKILKFWETNRIFQKTLEKNRRKHGSPLEPVLDRDRGRGRCGAPGKTFVFYEGPPYANGKPGIHHVLARVVKDVILRYKTMRGYYVPRRAGWDTHGLPVEMAAEKALGLKSKKDIEKFGVKLFNQKAKEQVWLYKDEWENMTRRIGYWLDLKNAYVTYEPEYIETLWWTLAQIAKKKLLYKGHKVVPWCTRCGTALSSHELAQGYKETTDQSVYVKFRLEPYQKIGEWFTTDVDTYVLSWTTTPWTLPGNVALAVGADTDYVVLKKFVNKKFERWIVAKDLVRKSGNIFGQEADIREEFKGRDLIGLSYEPLFNIAALKTPAAYKIYAAGFVNTEEGTGVVHTAVMYGEDDYQLGKKVGLPQAHTVNEEGKFKSSVPGLAGMYVKSKETEEKIFEHLRARGFFLKLEPYTHEYPYCWRCDTPILYYARTSWFIAVSKLRDKLLKANKKINWIPGHLREGRFGEWLREVKDWNLSRERYWGAPLPIWECGKCKHHEVVGGLDKLNTKAGGARNNYWIMRHGEAESNIFDVIDDGKKIFHLTPRGRDEAVAAAKKFAKNLAEEKCRIDLIIASDVTRTKQTAEIVAARLGTKHIVSDRRLREIHLGELEGCHDNRYRKMFPTYEERFAKKPKGGESLRDLRKRVWEFLAETEKKYKGKNILLVSHEYPAWMMFHAALGWSEKQAIADKIKQGDNYITFAEIRKLDLKVAPRNDTGEVDLHRPFTDTITWPCSKCNGKMRRVPEVADVWYDSGAMPYAQMHWPFERSSQLPAASCQPPNYPADYIAEGMDQTRGWFYTLLAVGTALGCEAPYKNVISLGLINDKFGQKMSKSKGNVVDPWAVIAKHGADAVRWYFYTVNPPGEPKNFDENEIAKTYRQMHLIAWNSLVFWQTYAHKNSKFQIPNSKFSHVLDQWILARLNETVSAATKNLEKYDIREAALVIERLVDDLSRWYIRRSRRRLQRPSSRADFRAASSTLGFILQEIAKLIAPFAPFFAETLYTNFSPEESAHLADWPKPNSKFQIPNSLLKGMAEIRRLASLALAKRAEAGIKVRQPLASLQIRSTKSEIRNNKELLAILAEEVNAKEIVFDKKIKSEVELDTIITPELKEEGILRELVRMIQGLRQEAKLKPRDRVVLMLQLPAEWRLILARNAKNEKFLKSEVGAKAIEYKKSEKFGAELNTKTAEGENIWIGLRRA